MAVRDGRTSGLGGTGFMVAMLVDLMFALNVVAMKVVVDAAAPLLAVALRMGVVFLLCAVAFRLVPGRNRVLMLYGLLNGGLFPLLLNLALSMTTNVGVLAIAGQLSVPFALLLGAVLFGEKLSPRKAMGVALAFAGVAVLVIDPHVEGQLSALLVMALAAMTWGGGALVQRRLGGISVMNIQAWNGLTGAVMVAPFALWLEPQALGRLGHVHWDAIGWFAFSCVGSTVVGQGALAWLLQRYPVSAVMPLMLASPVMATILSSLYFGTRITPIMILGGLIALVGVAIVSLTKDKAPPVAGEPVT